MTEYGFPVFTLCSVVLDLLPLTQDVSGTQDQKVIIAKKIGSSGFCVETRSILIEYPQNSPKSLAR